MPSPQRMLLLSFFPITILLAAASALCLTAPGARAAAMATADVSGGYAGKMLNKVVEIWAPPPALKGDFQVQVEVALDATGRVVNCTPVRPSGMEALDSSACGAVRQIGSFGKTPSDAALEVHLSFWTGMPRGKVRPTPIDDVEAMHQEERARTKAEAAMSDSRAASAEERARERAEEAAKASGMEMPSVRPAPVAPAQVQPAPAAPNTADGKSRKNSEKAPRMAGYSQDSSPATVAIGASGSTQNGAAATAKKAPALTIAPTPLPEQPRPETNSMATPAAENAAQKAPATAISPTDWAQKTAETAVSPTGAAQKAPAIAKPENTASTPVQATTQPQGSLTYGPDNKAQSQYGKKHDKYFSGLVWQLANTIAIPVETPPGTYYPTVRLTVTPATGAIEKFVFLEKSGDRHLDSFVRRGIKKAGSVPPPPGALGTTLDITLTLVRR